ncbi:FAD binding domain-containing protein [Lewinella sp. IMCC34183]|uniref:FAD binding domain-containing protein n=1 Tax=Lewinella sp. IMCC34183 TaxID=2248762 RepID=UPI000E243ED8|nr:xanthine dehydrogenase family protein subunit M [Lewinella sp. IMCC34183]
MRPYEYIRSSSPAEALRANAASEKPHYLGGGTNLIDLMKEDVERPDTLIEVSGLDFQSVTANAAGGYTLGAMISNTDTANHPEVKNNYPLLSMAMVSAATEQIRNMATNGGNLLQRTRCPYFYETSMPCNKREPGSGCGALTGMNALHAIFGWSKSCVAVNPSDMCTALAALGATVVVLQPDGGSERRIPFADFHRLPGDTPEKDTNLEPGELIVGIELGEPKFSDNYYYLKIRERSSYAFALVSVAAGLQLDGNRIVDAGLAMGGVAHKPWKLTAAEEYLRGKVPEAAVFEEAAERAMADARPLDDNEYKVEMGKKAIVRALMQAYERTA